MEMHVVSNILEYRKGWRRTWRKYQSRNSGSGKVKIASSTWYSAMQTSVRRCTKKSPGEFKLWMGMQALCDLPDPHPLWVVGCEVDAYVQREISAAGKYELEEGGDRNLIDIICVGIIDSARAARSAVAGVVVKQCADVQFGPDMAGSCGQIAPAAAHAGGNNTVSERKEIPDGAEDFVGEAIDGDITRIVTTQYGGNTGSDAALEGVENFGGRVSNMGLVCTLPQRTTAMPRVPNELLGEIASLLPLAARCRAVCVSRRWRAALLATPALWENISVTLEQDTAERWIPALQLLFRYNAGPLTLDIEWFYSPDPAYRALHDVYDLLAHHMSHIKSLSLGIPSLDGATISRPCSIARDIPIQELARRARISTGTNECDVTALLVLAIGFRLPNTESVTEGEYVMDNSLRPCERPIALRVKVNRGCPGVRDFVAMFPNAPSVKYSCADDANAIRRVLRSVEQPKAIEIFWSVPHIYLPWYTPSKEASGLSVRLDGQEVLVDVDIKALEIVLTSDDSDVVKALVPQMQKLLVPAELWALFSQQELLPDLDVTLLIRPRALDAWPTSPLRLRYLPKSIKTLTLAISRRTGADREAPNVLPADHLASFIGTVASPESLRLLVLQSHSLTVVHFRLQVL
ncbi:hypothetical protein EXIGLDRAFT_750141 [Exidia glandulosa HHB12029]|uniref:F-box domain-containing protein n=1 Tax=Exidia glandulosa HHB12029 TaxID=1314781 RepID=A0A165H2Z8_EXIGL|nr:hypothetical protein EXIGLDRAFT_750141 [Exidia glandulosa HHB12029]